MKYLTRIFMPFMLFFLTFILVGEINVWQKEMEVCNSDYCFDLIAGSMDEEKAFSESIIEYVKENDIEIYAVWSEILSWDEFIIMVYSDGATKNVIKEKIECTSDRKKYTSLFVGSQIVEFRGIEEVADTEVVERYYANCSAEEFDEFCETLSKEFKFENVTEGHYAQKCDRWVLALWFVIAFVLIVYKYFDNSSEKKRIYIRYINGVDKNKQIINSIIINTLCFASTFFIARAIVSTMTSIYFCSEFAYKALMVILIITNLHLLSFIKMDMKKILTRDNVSKKVVRFMEVSTTVIIVVTILCLSTNIKSINDAYKTVKQDKIWEQYKDYVSVYFASGMANFSRNESVDSGYMKEFYEEYIDKYNLKFNYDTVNNSRGYSIEKSIQNPIVYVNKNCSEEIESLGIDISEMTDKYYIISTYSKDELKENKVFEDVEFALGYEESELTVIEMEKDFEWFTYDVRMENLSDNYRENPVLVYNTTSEAVKDEAFSGSAYMTSLVKLSSESDFVDFIKKIGYEKDVYYSDAVYDVYKEGAQESRNMLRINLIISILMMVLFNAVIATVLKLDFDARAEEVAINKVLGKSLIKRYKKIIRFVVVAYVVSVVIAVKIVVSVYNFHMGYLLTGCGITMVNLAILVIYFVKNYESRRIINVLKGGR